MSLTVQPRHFKYLIPAAGLLGLTLRAVLYTAGMDSKRLLVRGHWTAVSTWVLTGAVAVVLFLWCRQLTGSKKYLKAYPASRLGAAASVLAGIAFLLSPIQQFPSQAFATIELALRFAAAASLICVGFCRFTGRRPFFLFHCAVCLYLALRLVCQYRLWSADPQIQNYAFYLGSHVALMFAAYQMAAFDAGFGSHRLLWGSGLAAVYLSIVAILGSNEGFFLLSCSLWIWTNLSHPSSRKRVDPKTNHTTQEDTP